jgi:GAF domain-containing protein
MDKNIVEAVSQEVGGNGKSLSKLLNSLAMVKESLGVDSWVGIYFYDEVNHNLFLGPFQGSRACEYINPGKGVVGTCFASKRPLYVNDVTKFPGYISCDAKVKSEACFPLKYGEDTIEVLDIDSPKLDGLKDDLDDLEEIANLLANFGA